MALLISLKSPLLSERYLSVSFPFFVMLLATLAFPSRRVLQTMAFLFLLLLNAHALSRYFFSADFGKTQWRAASSYIEHSPYLSRTVLVNPAFAKGLLTFYLPPSFSVQGISSEAPDTISGLAVAEVWLAERGTVPSLKSYFTARGFELVQEQLFPLENGIRLFYFKQTNAAASH